MSQSEDRLRRTLPLILLGIGVVSFFILRAVVPVSGTSPRPNMTIRDAEELRSFSVWGITFCALVVASCWGAIAGAVIARQYLSPRAYRVTLILAAVLTVAIAVISRAVWDARDLLALVEEARRVPVRYVTMTGNALAIGSATLIVAACIALATAPSSPPLPELRRRIAESRLLLYSAAALLVIGVAEIFLVFQLPVAVERTRMAAGEPHVLQHLTGSITLSAGLLYTSVLLILFVPVAVVHAKWIDDAWQASGGGKHAEWLETNGLHRSIGSTASQLAAAASPLLAAVGLLPS
jgi:hypothetical protein